MEVIDEINQNLKKYTFLELAIYSYSNKNLTIVGSNDLLYYHDFEILFVNVHTIVCNGEWIADTDNQIIYDVSKTNEGRKFNMDFEVIQGNRVFKILSQDGAVFFIAAEGIKFIKRVTKYII